MEGRMYSLNWISHGDDYSLQISCLQTKGEKRRGRSRSVILKFLILRFIQNHAAVTGGFWSMSLHVNIYLVKFGSACFVKWVPALFCSVSLN